MKLYEKGLYMKTAAVIAEYNPFHNGHLYQLNTIRNALHADCIIALMSGNFVQRGEPAVIDKFTRCRMALLGGADLVFELPVYYSTGSAEFFAQGAVSLLDKLGVVDMLHFGSELGSIDALSDCADIFVNEPPEFKALLNACLKDGLSFPSAQAKAACGIIHQNGGAADTADMLSKPNNTLGIEYLKALKLRGSSIQPVTLKRKGSSYHDKSLHLSQTAQSSRQEPDYASANAIRAFLSDAVSVADMSPLAGCMPSFVYNILNSEGKSSLIFQEDFSSVMHYALLSCLQTGKSLEGYYDVTKQVSDIIVKNLPDFVSLPQFILLCKSKNLTYSRISRCLTHILLGLTSENISWYKASDYASYARLLGFSKNGLQLLKSIKANSSIPVITKPLRDKNNLSGAALSSLNADIYASQLYYMAQGQKYGRRAKNEYTQEIVRI